VKSADADVVDQKPGGEATFCSKLERVRTLLREPDVARSRICSELGLYCFMVTQ